METPTHAPVERAGDILSSIVARARGLARVVRNFALVEMIAAVILWLILTNPFQASVAGLAAGAALLFVLMVPGAVIWLFYSGLASVASLPESLGQLAQGGTRQGVQLMEAAREAAGQPGWKSGWNVVRSVLNLRSTALRAKGVLLGLGVVVKLRFLNPVFLVIVFVAFAASVAIVGIAAIAVLVTLLTLLA